MRHNNLTLKIQKLKHLLSTVTLLSAPGAKTTMNLALGEEINMDSQVCLFIRLMVWEGRN